MEEVNFKSISILLIKSKMRLWQSQRQSYIGLQRSIVKLKMRLLLNYQLSLFLCLLFLEKFKTTSKQNYTKFLYISDEVITYETPFYLFHVILEDLITL